MLAVDPDSYQIVLMSAVGSAREVQELAKILAPKGGPYSLTVSPGPMPYDCNWKACKMTRDPVGYHVRFHRLMPTHCQAMLVSKRPGLLLTNDEEELWQSVTSDAYTTPLLRSWMPYVKKQLTSRGFLRSARVFGCKPLLLELSTPQLDDVVSEGIKSGELEIS